MPPKRDSASSGGSTSTSGGSSGSSSSSSSSGSDSSSDSDSSSSDSDNSAPGAEEAKKAPAAPGNTAKNKKGAALGKVAPKKSAIAKPAASSSAKSSSSWSAAKKSQLSDDADSDLEDFSLPTLFSKAKIKATPPTATPTPPSTTSSSKYKSIFSESDSDSLPAPQSKSAKKPANSAKSKTSTSVSSAKKNAVRSPSPKVSKPKKTTAPSKSKPSSSSSIKSKSNTKQRRNRSSSSSSSSPSQSSINTDEDMQAAIKKSLITAKKEKAAAAAAATKKAYQKSSNKSSTVKKVSMAESVKLAAMSSGSDSEKIERPTTRQTRGQAPRRSRHITGKKRVDSQSESDVEAGNSSPHKMKPGRPPKNTSSSSGYQLPVLPPVRYDIDNLARIETRKCPVPGCDSSGHLGGKLDRHFLMDACPVYHNMTSKECREFRSESSKRSSNRKKAMSAMVNKSPLQSPTSDQRRYSQQLKESRGNINVQELKESSYDVPEDREANLKGLTSGWDLKLFREAQAAAAEDIENSLKGLPDSKMTKFIQLGRHEMEVWYQSRYPDEFSILPKMYICEFCLKYLKSGTVLKRHVAKCVWKHPPGDEIYRKDKLSVFEICGKRYKQYCQSLCLLAKFFLDHKTLYFDVEPFLFYVMTAADSEGCHIVGYFSKEKNSYLNYNVSCILTLPPYQRQGYGRLLIDFSYLLSRSEGKIGSPEKPLSDLGLISYRSYWKDVLLEYICNYPEKELSLKAFSEERGINSYDIVSTLQYLGMIKYWKGKHVILKKEDLIEDFLRKNRNRLPGRKISPGALKWKPYEPTSREKKQALAIKKNREEKQKKR